MDMRRAQRVFPSSSQSIGLEDLSRELAYYGGTVMLVYCEEESAHYAYASQIEAALPDHQVICIEANCKQVKPDENLLRQSCWTARDANVRLVLAIDDTASVMLANAISSCSWCDSDPLVKFYFNVGTPRRANIPVAHILTSDKTEEPNARRMTRPVFGPYIAPEFTVRAS